MRAYMFNNNRSRPSESRCISIPCTQEMGKTLAESEAEVADNANMDEYCELVMQATVS